MLTRESVGVTPEEFAELAELLRLRKAHEAGTLAFEEKEAILFEDPEGLMDEFLEYFSLRECYKLWIEEKYEELERQRKEDEAE